MEFFQVFIVALVLVALSFAGLAIKMLLFRKGRFPNIHIGSNQALKQRGVTCFTSFDKMEQENTRKGLRFKELSIADDELHAGC
ncbi:MAG: hypothetical protein AB7V25_08445 [Mangrovibacterium sp.]